MPTYIYRCKSCEHTFEAQRSIAERLGVPCEKCGEPCVIVPQAATLAWSPASAEGGRPNYKERLRHH